MKDDDRSRVGGRHAASAARRSRRAPLLLAVATAVGVWHGLSAPEVSPVGAPVPVAQVAPVTPVSHAAGPGR